MLSSLVIVLSISFAYYLARVKSALHLRGLVEYSHLIKTKLRLHSLKLIIVPFIDLRFFKTQLLSKGLKDLSLPKIRMTIIVTLKDFLLFSAFSAFGFS